MLRQEISLKGENMKQTKYLNVTLQGTTNKSGTLADGKAVLSWHLQIAKTPACESEAFGAVTILILASERIITTPAQ